MRSKKRLRKRGETKRRCGEEGQGKGYMGRARPLGLSLRGAKRRMARWRNEDRLVLVVYLLVLKNLIEEQGIDLVLVWL